MNVPTADSWNARNTVLSAALADGPLSSAYHCLSTAAFWTASGFLRHVLPPSFDTDVPRFTSASRSVKYAYPWSSTTMSVSPPPGPASGRICTGETTWKLAPPSVDLWMKEFCVVVPHGPDSHHVPLA